MINEATKKSILYIAIVTGYVLMATLILNNWLNSSTTYEIKAQVVESTSVPTTSTTNPVDTQTPESGQTKQLGSGVVVGIKAGDLNYEVDKRILELIYKYFGEQSYTAIRVAHCESRFQQNAVNVNKDGTKDIGTFQINEYWHGDKGDLYDLEENIKIAKQIYDESGWWPWVCYWKYGDEW